MKRIISKLLLTSALTLGLTNPATALDFTFSFSNTMGGIEGTVTGRILGLTDNALSVPSGGVFVDSAPDDFEDVGDFNFLSIFVTISGTENNRFMVTNGQITEGRFLARGRVESIGRDVSLNLSANPSFSDIAYSQDLNDNGEIVVSEADKNQL